MRQDTFGRRLRRVRDEMHMNQKELRNRMEQLGVEIGASYVSELERTDKMPKLEVARAMARVLDTTTDYLAMLTDDPSPVREEAAPNYITPEADEVARIMDALPREARADLLAIARRLAAPPSGQNQTLREQMMMLTIVEQQLGLQARRTMESALFGKNEADTGNQ